MKAVKLLLGFALLAGSWPASAYKVLELTDNHGKRLPVQWRGSPPVIRVALVRTAYTLAPSHSRATCRGLLPLDGMLVRSNVSEDAFVAEAMKAMGDWSSAANVRFEYVDDEKNAHVRIGVMTEPEGQAFADVYLKGNDGVTHGVHSAVICFNPKFRFEVVGGDCKKTLNIRYVLAHEIGHVIGLDHPQGKALMGYRCDPNNMQMTSDDIAGAVMIYGAREKTPTH